MLDKIAKVIRDYKEDPNIVITEETTFAELELDSLATVELIMNLEDELGVTIELDQGIKTVGDLIRLLEKQK
ncbi:MAG: acyl carrier protein [Clostridiales bacterium]|nr:acyl carrier protein [Clostridiales bacterium]HOA85318.1 phosphopantetheine-binding protein [Bacillota bacterium]